MIEARVVRIYLTKAGKVRYELEIIASKGVEAIVPGTHILRSDFDFNRNRLHRMIWDNELQRAIAGCET